MQYIIFDIEANARKYKTDKPQEIIQIGAVKLNKDLSEADYFSKIVQPTVCPKLSVFSRELTGISQDEINNAQTFTEVYNQFYNWIDTSKNVLICWGSEDIRFLKNDCKLNHIEDHLPLEFINLLDRFNEFAKSKNDYSLSRALEYLEIEQEGEMHTALSDARNTATIFKRIFQHIDTQELDVYKRHPLNSKIRSGIKHIVKKMVQENINLEWEIFLTVADSRFKNINALINEENAMNFKEHFLFEVNKVD